MIRLISIPKITLATLGILLPLAVCAAAPKPQSTQPAQTDSLADAARKAREQKAKDQAKPAKVYTNDDISNIKGSISVVGAQPDADAAKPDADKDTAAQASSKDEAQWRAKFADARKVLSEDARELDITQRELNLKQQQYYSDPNVALKQQNDRKDIDDAQAQIEVLKAKVEKDKQAIADLEEELRKAGGDPGWAQESSSTTPLPVPAQPPSDGQSKNP